MFATNYPDYLAEMFKYHQFVKPMTEIEWNHYYKDKK